MQQIEEHLEEKKMPPEYVPEYTDGTMIIFPANLVIGRNK